MTSKLEIIEILQEREGRGFFIVQVLRAGFSVTQDGVMTQVVSFEEVLEALEAWKEEQEEEWEEAEEKAADEAEEEGWNEAES